jgi:PAS domain S-box-containing protein
MNRKRDGIEARKSLRAEADAMVGSLSPEGMTTQPVEVLLHELLVHKIELEMQNEELRRAQLSLEDARDRYLDLYEFAPVGYITLNREGFISESNLTGAALLGVNRINLINRPFSKFVAPQDRDRWHCLFQSIMELAAGEKQAFTLEMSRDDGSVCSGFLDCLRRESSDAPPVLRVALTDISRIKLAEKE